MKILISFFILFLTSLPVRAGDLMDEFSGFYHSPVILELGEVLDSHGHPKSQWLLTVVKGEAGEVEKVRAKMGIKKTAQGKSQRKRILFFGFKSDGTPESMDFYLSGQPMSSQNKGYLAYKMWLLDFKKIMASAPKPVEQGGQKIIIIQDRLLCQNIMNNLYFHKRYSGRINRPGGFQLGGYGGEFKNRFQPLVVLNCKK